MQGHDQFPVVGVGASAGGVEALQTLFRAMPASPLAAAFVVVTHLGSDRHSSLPEILRACTTMPVVAAADGDRVQVGHVYVLSNDSLITLVGGRLVLRPQSPDAPRERQPIDLFLASLAADRGEQAVGIVLSGSGSDGTLGLKAIKENGGFTLAQGSDGTAPRYPSMPDSATAGGGVDLVLSAEQMPERLAALVREHPAEDATTADQHGTPLEEGQAAQHRIAEILRARIGHDFTGYKSKTFFRRVQRRMQVLQVADLKAYIALLEESADEAGKLFRDLLISVTGFFRDPASFGVLASRVMPALFEGRTAEDTVRIWVPGCATGEEAYSLAILALEQAASRPGSPRVQIFATDIDEAALGVARNGRYPAPMLADVSPERLARFFVADGETYAVSKEMRELCVFSSHSIIRDAPFSRIDMVSCRNLLIYMGGQLQEQVIPLFHYALRPGGFLFLGVSETAGKYTELFSVEDKQHRIYRRREAPVANLPLRIGAVAPGAQRSWQMVAPPRRPRIGSAVELRQMANAIAAEQVAPPHLLVNADGDIVYQSANLGAFLEPSTGVPSRHLLSVARRGLRLDLRAALREATEKLRPVQRPRVALDLGGSRRVVTLTVAPLPQRDGYDSLFMVAFAEAELAPSKADAAAPAAGPETGQAALIEQIEGELRETRERLQSTTEEYETATEELKSANEEMVSVNEELQSINEELETSKEELQSVNEELQTSNLELTSKVAELDQASADMRNLFDSTEIATIFLDRHLVIRSFTPAVTSIFNLVASDRGRSLSSFTSHLDKVDLQRDAQRVLDGKLPVERRVTAHGGVAHYLMRMLPYTTTEDATDGIVVTFFDITKVVESEVLETLVDELNHRVRNMLQVVSAISAHTLRRAVSLEEFGETFTGRVKALAAAHELVSHGGWRDVPLLELIEKELKPYTVGSDRLVAQGVPVWLKPNAALALGMVLHEMATNATKHGALSSESGRVSILWTKEEIAGVAHLVLRWAETGGPKPSLVPESRGFGSELMERQLRHDLKGQMQVDFAETGLRCMIALPASIVSDQRPNMQPRPARPTA